MDWFNIDEVTGIIRVARGGDLEWEQDSALHTLSVVAVDQGKPSPQTTTTTLTVQVIHLPSLRDPYRILTGFFFTPIFDPEIVLVLKPLKAVLKTCLVFKVCCLIFRIVRDRFGGFRDI